MGQYIFAPKTCVKNSQNARILHNNCPKTFPRILGAYTNYTCVPLCHISLPLPHRHISLLKLVPTVSLYFTQQDTRVQKYSHPNNTSNHRTVGRRPAGLDRITAGGHHQQQQSGRPSSGEAGVRHPAICVSN